MRENLVKEYISESFIRLLMAKNRYKILSSDMGDDGVDLTITTVIARNRGNRINYSDSGKMLNIQLKCTTVKQVSKLPDGFIYKLRVKNYEDLIYARDDNYTKLILIVFILPDEEMDWMEIKQDYIKLCKHAFWFYPNSDYTLKKSEFKDPKSTVPIKLLDINRLDLDFTPVFRYFHAN